ncbi:MAG: hypothetical protein ACRDXC_00480 [Acidimicrobiales bacterium]
MTPPRSVAGVLAGYVTREVECDSGEHKPSLSTLVRLAAALDEDFTVDINSNGARLRQSA